MSTDPAARALAALVVARYATDPPRSYRAHTEIVREPSRFAGTAPVRLVAWNFVWDGATSRAAFSAERSSEAGDTMTDGRVFYADDVAFTRSRFSPRTPSSLSGLDEAAPESEHDERWTRHAIDDVFGVGARAAADPVASLGFLARIDELTDLDVHLLEAPSVLGIDEGLAVLEIAVPDGQLLLGPLGPATDGPAVPVTIHLTIGSASHLVHCHEARIRGELGSTIVQRSRMYAFGAPVRINPPDIVDQAPALPPVIGALEAVERLVALTVALEVDRDYHEGVILMAPGDELVARPLRSGDSLKVELVETPDGRRPGVVRRDGRALGTVEQHDGPAAGEREARVRAVDAIDLTSLRFTLADGGFLDAVVETKAAIAAADALAAPVVLVREWVDGEARFVRAERDGRVVLR